MSNTSVVCGAQVLTVDDLAACFRDRPFYSVWTSLERERAAQPVRAATRASSIPFTSLRPNPHKSWADTHLVIWSRSIGRGLFSPFVADSRQSVAKYQQRSDRLGWHHQGHCCTELLRQSCAAVPSGRLFLSKRSYAHGSGSWLTLTSRAESHRCSKVGRRAVWHRGCGRHAGVLYPVIVQSCPTVQLLTPDSSNHRSMSHRQQKQWLHSVRTRRVVVRSAFPKPIESRSPNTRVAILPK